MNNKGYILFVFHAHLPFVRHPQYEQFLEENWLFDAISHTYLPLLRIFSKIENDGINCRVVFSLSPTLTSMLCDELLQNSYIRRLEQLLDLAEKECVRTKEDPDFHPLAKMYKKNLEQNYFDFTEVYRKNILRGFRDLQKKGIFECITSPR